MERITPFFFFFFFFCRLCIIYVAVWILVFNYYFPNHVGKSRLIIQTVQLKEQNSYIHLKLEKLYYPYLVWFFPNLNFRSSILPKQLSRGVPKICSKFIGEHPCQSATSKQLYWNCCIFSEHLFLRTPLPGHFSACGYEDLSNPKSTCFKFVLKGIINTKLSEELAWTCLL